jgi:hypothetical protein
VTVTLDPTVVVFPLQSSEIVEPLVLMTAVHVLTAAELVLVSVTDSQYPAPQSDVATSTAETPFVVRA